MKLLVLDVEGTLFRTTLRLAGTDLDSTMWQSLAASLGSAAVAQEVETHRKWETGGYATYLEWVKETIEIHLRHGLSRELFQNLVRSAAYNEHVVTTLNSVDRRSYQPVLISGGFQELARRAQEDCGIEHAFAACQYYFGLDGRLLGYNLLPCDFSGKLDFVRLLLAEYKLTAQDWVFVGDGANDVPIALAAPLSIAYRGHPKLRAVCNHAIDDFSALTALL